MLEKVLIANRAEIALRVVRACRDLGVASVAVYSDADRSLRYVREADEAIAIGGAPARESYLRVDKIIDAARRSGADSIHPGYGFLAENAELARATTDAGLVFIGPPAAVIETLGSKLETRRIMIEAGVPVLPGTDASSDLDELRRQSEEMGYPVLVKPSGGGGGRGMRVAHTPEELKEALDVSRREAASSFADSDVYVEKLLTDARHIEVQIIADSHGQVVHVGDRDCSIQRRHQKVVEEGPAPDLTEEQHAHVRNLAVQATRAAGYRNAGTVEFLYDGKGNFYLLEVNTRIQVEHGVTEMISGIDLVAEQIRIASGEPLSFGQDEVLLRGSAIECRVYAEDPKLNFLSSPGLIEGARFPAGPWVREDRSYDVGDVVTPHYDGMLGKLVVWGPTREIAIARTRRALAEYRYRGIKSNLGFLRWLIDSDAFRLRQYGTRFVEREFRPDLLPDELPFGEDTAAAAATPAVAPAPVAAGATPSSGVAEVGQTSRIEIFAYQHQPGEPTCDCQIFVVPLRAGDFQAVPVAPGSQHWAQEEHRRSGATASEAVDLLVREVLSRKALDEVFPELGMSY